ncbi:MAG: OsmC family protein [Bacteroidia bacterium]|nr:OsmC family protein [Bacteroidia bacterium]
MNTTKVVYKGNLRTEATHIKSGDTLLTDAPIDNNGKGEAFSPTDLVATAALTCMITIMGISAEKNDFSMGEVSGEVKKVMTSGPRRIAELHIELDFQNHNLNETEKGLLEAAALSCPVTRSIHPEIMVNVKFNYS